MSEAPSRPVPARDRYVPTGAFWEGAQAGRLMLQYCRDSGRYQHPPHPLSLYTGSQNVEWRAVSGRGVVYAATVLRVPGAGLAGRVPLVVATVELAEGVRIIANILDSAPDAVRIGDVVELAWDQLYGGTPYPAFRIISREGNADAQG